MRFKTVCYINRTPLTERDYKRFGIETLKKHGFSIVFLDLTAILNPLYLGHIDLKNAIADDVKIIRFNTKNEFIEYFRGNNSDVLVIDLMSADQSSFFVYRALKRFNISYATLCANSLPVESRFFKKTSLLERLLATKGKFNARGMFYKLCKFIVYKLTMYVYLAPYGINGLQPPKYIFAGGLKSMDHQLPRPDKKSNIIWAHALDYDLIIENSSRLHNDHAVFLDEYVPFHPDFVITGEDLVDANKYYAGLRRFFDWFENAYKIPVLIAAHPRSRYDKNADYYGRRKIEKGKTPELIAGASCVLTHGSTAINYAVYYRKPMIFLTNNEFELTSHCSYTNSVVFQFNKSAINVDAPLPVSLDNEFEVSEELYSKYIANFLKVPGTPNKLFWDIVADAITSN